MGSFLVLAERGYTSPQDLEFLPPGPPLAGASEKCPGKAPAEPGKRVKGWLLRSKGIST